MSVAVRVFAQLCASQSTGVPEGAGTGTFDRLSAKLDAHAKTFGFKEMTCLWRGAVDGATPEIKRQYAEMHRAPAQGAAMSTSTGRWSEAGALRRLDG